MIDLETGHFGAILKNGVVSSPPFLVVQLRNSLTSSRDWQDQKLFCQVFFLFLFLKFCPTLKSLPCTFHSHFSASDSQAGLMIEFAL